MENFPVFLKSVLQDCPNPVLPNPNIPSKMKPIYFILSKRNSPLFPTSVFLEILFPTKLQIFTSSFQLGIKTEGKMLAFSLGRKYDFPRISGNVLGWNY